MYFKLAIYVMKVFLKVQRNACFSAQNVLDPLLSFYVYFFMPKVLLKDQKMLNLRRMKNDYRGPSNLCAILNFHLNFRAKIYQSEKYSHSYVKQLFGADSNNFFKN